MKSQIETNHGVYEYEELEFKRGKKKIDLDISKENLIDFGEVMAAGNIKFGLIYGTLLGAIRENNFIKHDEDVDVFILAEDRQKLLNYLFKLEEYGFKVGRYDGALLSIMRNGEYIDIYFFKKSGLIYRKCDGWVIKAKFLENTKEYPLFGAKFNVPADTEKLLILLYGKDWKIPKENSPATNFSFYLSSKRFIRRRSKKLYNILKSIKRKLKI